MKLDHLTFEQLYKLSQPETLMRVTQAYHKALRRCWNEWGYLRKENFSVSVAEAEFPCRGYQKVIQFLRSSELKTALRKAADAYCIPPSATVSELRRLTVHGFPNVAVRHTLGDLIVKFCQGHGVVSAWLGQADNVDTVVYVATDEVGCAALESKKGLRWEDIVAHCAQNAIDANRVFWWLPWTDDKTGWRINPCLWPTNTPDYQETAKGLVVK